MGGARVEAVPDPTLLVVGSGEPLLDGIVEAAERRGVSVERTPLALCAHAAVAVAPDAVLLVGDAARDGGGDALARLGASPLAAVVPVVLLGDPEGSLTGRLAAFRQGVTAYLPRSASVDATAERLTRLLRNVPEGAVPQIGRLGEASLDSFVQAVARELRQGILSVRGEVRSGEDEEIRLVLGEGAGLEAALQQFVERVHALIERAEVVRYEWEDQVRGGVSLLSTLDGDGAGAAPSIDGARVLLVDDDVARADVIAQELRDAGAVVAVADTQGRGLARARSLDAQALVVGDSVVHGPGFALVRRLRADARMRWAHMIVVPWDEVWTEGTAPPRLDSLMSRIARASQVEAAIHERIAAKGAFDVRLEALGAARLLRQLELEQGASLRLTVWNLRGTVRVDVGEGLLIGARAAVPARKGGECEGLAAVACLLPMATGRARIERVDSPLTTNVMSPVAVALGQAEVEGKLDAPEAPPQSLRRRVGGSVFPVAIARTEPPPAPDPAAGAVVVPLRKGPPAGSRRPTIRGMPPPARAGDDAAVDGPDDRDDPTVRSGASQELALTAFGPEATGPTEPHVTIAARRRIGGWISWTGALLILAGALVASWWTGWPREAWGAVALSPRGEPAPVARASRPPEPQRWTSPGTALSDTGSDEGDIADAPTGRHLYPQGADPSFAVPAWIGDLSTHRRDRRARELRSLGFRNLRNGRPDRALTWYRRAWWFEESAWTARGLCRTYLALEDPAQAVLWADKAVDLDAGELDGLVLLGDALRAAGRLDEAHVTYERALEIAPNSREVQRRLELVDRPDDPPSSAG